MDLTGNLSDFEQPAVTVDLVLLTVAERVLQVLAIRRPAPPAAGAWALPGGFVHIDESIDQTARRVLRDKAHLPDAYVEQLYTFGALGRDPRGRVISVAHYALVVHTKLVEALNEAGDLALLPVIVPWNGASGGPVHVRCPDGEDAHLAFDHDCIVGAAVQRLRGKLDYTALGLELLPDRFPLRLLQEVHEAILGRPLTKPAFRRKMLERGYLVATGEREAAGAFRPAELYRRAAPVAGRGGQ